MVAVIGGLLVARVVGFVTQRDALLLSVRDLERHRDALASAKQAFDDSELELLVPRLRRWAMGTALLPPRANAEAVFDNLRQTWGPSDLEFVREISDGLVDDVNRIRDSIAQISPPLEIDTDLEAMYARGLSRTPGMEHLEQAVVVQVSAERRSELVMRGKAGSEILSNTNIGVLASDSIVGPPRVTSHEIESAEKDLSVMRDRLLDVPPPSGVTPIVTILLTFSFASIVLPMVWLAERPLHDQAWKRLFVVIAFAAGVAAIFVYVVRLARVPTDETPSSGPDRA
jgi:hypothetical protein